MAVAKVLGTEKLSQLRRQICEAVPELDEDDVEERLGQLRQVAKYEYYLEILTELSYEEVAQIFVRVNSRGRPLRTVDLTLAILSARWPGVVAKLDEQVKRWADDGWSRIDTTFLVRALAAAATDTATLPGLLVTPTDKLDPAWERVKHGVEFLVQLLQENLGLMTSNLIPSMNALVPLAALLGRYDKDNQLTQADALAYWMLAVFVTGRFSAAADTKIAQDALATRQADPIRKLYENASLMGGPIRVTEEQLIGKGAGSPFFLLSYLVAKRAHAKDWWHDVEISETGSNSLFAIEYHHIHPRKTLKDLYPKGEINDLANLAFISATANKKISDRSPADYFPELLDENSGRDELSPHFVPRGQSVRQAENYRPFLVERRKLLVQAVNDLLGSYEPDWVTAVAPPADVHERALSVTLYAGPDARVVFDARSNGSHYQATAVLDDLERFLRDAHDGVASDVKVGPETATFEPEAEDVSVPIGPFVVTGSVEDWNKILGRERDDARAISSMPDVADSPPFEDERMEFVVLDSD